MPEAPTGKLTFEIGSLSLTFGLPSTPFVSSGYPRFRVKIIGTEISAYGTPVYTDTFYKPKHGWKARVLLNDGEDSAFELFTDIYETWLQSDPRQYITVIDETQLVKEKTPRLRAKAPLSPEVTENGLVKFYGLFNANFLSDPQYERVGASVYVDFDLIETEFYEA